MGPKKIKISMAQPPPTCPSTGSALIKSIMHRAVKIRVQHGSVRVWHGLVRVRHGSDRVRHGSVGSMSGCCKVARVRISARHPGGDPLPELAVMKKLERNSTNVMNECVSMNEFV